MKRLGGYYFAEAMRHFVSHLETIFQEMTLIHAQKALRAESADQHHRSHAYRLNAKTLQTLPHRRFSDRPGKQQTGIIIRFCQILALQQKFFGLVSDADVHQMSGNRRCRRHFRADQMGAPALALSPLEVAVRRGGAPLTGLQNVRVHGKAH